VKSFLGFYEQYRTGLFAYLIRFTGDRDLAGEIMQESFTRCLERYGNGQWEPRLLFAIGRNAALDVFRKRRRTVPIHSDPPDPGVDQEQRLSDCQRHQRVQQAIMQLGDGERDVLALAASGDLTYREIGELTGITEANVKVKVHRARVKLRAIMNEEDHERRTHQSVYR
jgi:RNA polymerase sigma-70 factor (ECF subfamily)